MHGEKVGKVTKLTAVTNANECGSGTADHVEWRMARFCRATARACEQ